MQLILLKNIKRLLYKFLIIALYNSQLQFELTGFDDGPLDWLASKIATWIGGSLKTVVTNRIEHVLLLILIFACGLLIFIFIFRKSAVKSINFCNPEHYFQPFINILLMNC